MAVTQGTVNVNSDATGWTRADVLDALETVFSNLGMHGGTAKTGVPVACLWPGQTNNESVKSRHNGIGTSSDNWSWDWHHCGGPNSTIPWAGNSDRNFEVSANGTSGYYMQETWTPTNINTTNNTLTVPWNRELTSEREIKFIPSGGDATNLIGGLALNTSYWVIRVDATTIKLASNLTDAQNNSEINLTAAPTGGWSSTTKFWDLQAGSSNKNITAYQGDILNFNVDATGLNICNGTSYDSTKTLTTANGTAGNLLMNAGYYISNLGTTSFTWNTRYWPQSEDNANVESFDKPASLPKGNVHQGTWVQSGTGQFGKSASQVIDYCYASANTSAMKGTITLKPNYSTLTTSFDPYWDVTIPGTVTGGGGVGKDLKLRVTRHNAGHSTSYRGRIRHIDVLNVTDGWSGTPTFTIPGEDIGGVATTNDIEFGTNTDETSENAGDGICSLALTDYGASSSFYQKSATGDYAILKLVHDDTKELGTTYWGFCPSQSNPYEMMLWSGTYWEAQNCWGTTATPTNESKNDYDWKGFYGFMDGRVGCTATWAQYPNPYDQNYFWHRNFATASQPTNYKLRIKYWRAQSPQDDKYAVISFVQVINDKIQEYFTFSLPTPTFGVTSPGVDLDHLYQGHITTYDTGSAFSYGSHYLRSLDIRCDIPSYQSSTNQAGDEPADTATLTQASLYGWVRNNDSGWPAATDRWSPNMNIRHSIEEREIIHYYRNADYDKTHSSMDYYRPIKGIPLLNVFAPCPYYLPDDFVMIPVGTAPGLTEFRTGDTVTISGSEKYEVIVAQYANSQTGLDGVNSGSTIGMLFCARIVG